MPRNTVGSHRRCCYGLCKSDARTKDYYENCNFYFISFPKPCLPFRQKKIEKSKINSHLKKCFVCRKSVRWVRLCGRSDSKFNSIYNITKDSYICSLHFVGESGPTEQFPEPIPCVSFNKNNKQKLHKKRTSLQEKYKRSLNTKDELKLQMKNPIVSSPDLSGESDFSADNLIKINEISLKREITEDQHEVVFPVGLEETKNSLNSVEELTRIKTEFNEITIKEEPLYEEIPGTKSVSVQTPKSMLKSKNHLGDSKTGLERTPIEIFEQSLQEDKTKSLFYTSLEFSQIKILFSALTPKCNNLNYGDCDEVNSAKRIKRDFTPRQELIVSLVYLRCAFPVQDLAFRFDVSTSLIKNIIITWVQFIFAELREQLNSTMFISRQKVAEKSTDLFKEFKNIRVILMCVEFYFPAFRYLNSENDHTYTKQEVPVMHKALIGCTPSGRISFVSSVYDGPTSNRQVFIESKMSKLLEKDDLVLIDKDIFVRDLIEKEGAKLHIPDFFERSRILQSRNDMKTVMINKQKCFVEKVVNRLKEFRVLQEELPYSFKKITSEILFVCVCVTNMNVTSRYAKKLY